MWMLYIFRFDAPSGYSGDDYITSVEPRITFYEKNIFIIKLIFIIK